MMLKHSELVAALRAAADELEGSQQLRDTVARLEGRISDLELELADARSADEVLDLIADVRRGIIDIDELYDHTLGIGPC